MDKLAHTCFAAAGLLLGTMTWAADRSDDGGCGHTLESVPKEIQQTLTPAYKGNSVVDLKGVAKALSVLMLEVGQCQGMFQSEAYVSKTKNQEIAEWQSLNQWLYRLVNFVDQEARGKPTVNWREEFQSFAQVFELKL